MYASLISLTCALLAQPAPPSLDNAFEIALGAAGLTRQSARFDASMMPFYRSGNFASPYFEACYADPWRIPFLMDMHRRQLATSGFNPLATVSLAARMLGQGSRRELLGNPIAAAEERAKQTNAFAVSLQRMKQRGLISGDVPLARDVPAAVQRAASLILEVALDAAAYRRAAFAGVPDLETAFKREIGTPAASDDPVAHQALLTFYRQVDMAYLYAASQDLSLAAVRASVYLSEVSPDEKYKFSVNTSWGRITLAGGSVDVHAEGTNLLVIDTGGNDTYLNGPANQSASNWLSVVLDSAGDDKYLSAVDLEKKAISEWPSRQSGSDKRGPGSAAFGVALLVDSKGNDLYRSDRPSFGSAVFGVSVLTDVEGDDFYDTYTNSIGFAKFGIGICEDLAGKDNYLGFNQTQGVGLTSGCGLLIDRTGNDIYVANDTVLDFPSPQSDQHNVSLSQGAGYGTRLDYINGKSLAGGIGILYDQAGDDSYSCGVFGQGVGYWEGVGCLWDAAGKDSYLGQWYVQGASAHFGVGYLEDDGSGSDSYTALMNMAQGAGHDFSIGILLDNGGDETYRGPNLSLGAGNANGIGLFVDRSGNDGYTSSGITLGQAAEAPKGSLRERALCLGVFLDLGGTDTYPDAFPFATNGKRHVNWRDRRDVTAESQLGIFWDR